MSDKPDVLELMNELEVVNFDCDDDYCYSIYVKYDEKVKEFLEAVKAREDSLDQEGSSIDIGMLAWERGIRFTGEKFIKEE